MELGSDIAASAFETSARAMAWTDLILLCLKIS